MQPFRGRGQRRGRGWRSRHSEQEDFEGLDATTPESTPPSSDGQLTPPHRLLPPTTIAASGPPPHHGLDAPTHLLKPNSPIREPGPPPRSAENPPSPPFGAFTAPSPSRMVVNPYSQFEEKKANAVPKKAVAPRKLAKPRCVPKNKPPKLPDPPWSPSAPPLPSDLSEHGNFAAPSRRRLRNNLKAPPPPHQSRPPDPRNPIPEPPALRNPNSPIAETSDTDPNVLIGASPPEYNAKTPSPRIPEPPGPRYPTQHRDGPPNSGPNPPHARLVPSGPRLNARYPPPRHVLKERLLGSSARANPPNSGPHAGPPQNGTDDAHLVGLDRGEAPPWKSVFVDLLAQWDPNIPNSLDPDIVEKLSYWSTLLQLGHKERWSIKLEVEFEKIEHVFGNCYLIHMLQYKNRIREGSNLLLGIPRDPKKKIGGRGDQGFMKYYRGKVAPIKGMPAFSRRAVQGRRACVQCIALSSDKMINQVTSIVINRFNERQMDCREYETLCKRLFNVKTRGVELHSPLVRYLLLEEDNPKRAPLFANVEDYEQFQFLNKYQKEAVMNVLWEDGKDEIGAVSLVAGPPGTGKTRTLATLARILLDQGIFVCCLTRTNVAARRIAETMVGDAASMLPNEMGLKVSREFYHEWHEDQYDELKRYKVDGFDRPLMICTIGSYQGSANRAFKRYKYSVFILDEASQILDLDGLQLFRHLPATIDRIVIFGDRKQLPPYVSKEADDMGQSLIDVLGAKLDPPRETMLRTQYRMPPSLGGLVSDLFYHGQLNHQKKDTAPGVHIRFKSVEGYQRIRNDSVYNPPEAIKALEIYRLIQRENYHKPDTADNPLVVILTFYESQRYQITKEDRKRLGKGQEPVRVFNVDGFQGQEAPFVIISTAARKELSGFLKDKRRINVAISRAKHFLCILGDRETLAQSEDWQKIVERCDVARETAEQTETETDSTLTT